MNFWPTHQSQECKTNTGRLEHWNKITVNGKKKKNTRGLRNKREKLELINSVKRVCAEAVYLRAFFSTRGALLFTSTAFVYISSVFYPVILGISFFHTLMRKSLSQVEKTHKCDVGMEKEPRGWHQKPLHHFYSNIRKIKSIKNFSWNTAYVNECLLDYFFVLLLDYKSLFISLFSGAIFVRKLYLWDEQQKLVLESNLHLSLHWGFLLLDFPLREMEPHITLPHPKVATPLA